MTQRDGADVLRRADRHVTEQRMAVDAMAAQAVCTVQPAEIDA